MKNLKEAKELLEKYKSITLEQLEQKRISYLSHIIQWYELKEQKYDS